MIKIKNKNKKANAYPEMPTPSKMATNYETKNDAPNTPHSLEEIHVNTHSPSALVEEVKIFNHNRWQSLTTAGDKVTDRACSGKAIETLDIRTPNQCSK